ncbi:hypothetical protein ACJW30_05G057600 [Castanea mollissima]
MIKKQSMVSSIVPCCEDSERVRASKVYCAVERPLQLAQAAAILEIFHSLVGLVRSPVSATLPQIASRLYLTWFILWSFPQT